MGLTKPSKQQGNLRNLANLEWLLPFTLPLLLLFSRTLADITVLLVGLTFLFRSYQLNDWLWAKQTWFKLSLVFWVYLLCMNAPLSIDMQDSVLYATAYIRWPLFAAAVAYWLLADEVRQRHLLASLLIVSLFIILDTSLQYFIGQDIFGHTKASSTRLTGPYTRPIPGIMLLRVFFIAMFAVFFLPRLPYPKHSFSFLLFILGIGTTFMFITGERMALMLFLTGSIVVIIGVLLNFQVNKAKLLASLITTFSLFLVMLIMASETAERSVYSIANKLSNFSSSDYGVVFRAAWSAWQEYFIFGSGLHTYKTVCENMGVLAQLDKEWGMQCSHPHNLYLQIAAETGLVGLTLFSISIVSIYFAALQKLVRSKQWLIASLSFTILSVSFWPLIGGISLLNNGVAALVWFGVGWVLSVSKSSIK